MLVCMHVPSIMNNCLVYSEYAPQWTQFQVGRLPWHRRGDKGNKVKLSRQSEIGPMRGKAWQIN